MEQRAEGEEKVGSKVRILMVGGSQIGKVGKEMGVRGDEVVESVDWMRIKGRLDKAEVKRVLRDLGTVQNAPDRIVMGGPGNSLFRHGKKATRGFCPERTVMVERGRDKEVKRVRVGYHMTDPIKINMAERRGLIDNVVELVKGVRNRFPDAEIYYMTMTPRHVNRCCNDQTHMTDDDCVTMTGFRRGVDAEIGEELTGQGTGVTVVEWWEALGWEEEGGLKGVRMSRVVSEDGVHLVPKATRDAAVFFLHRLADQKTQHGGGAQAKRRRMF
jgi:hypothetical protein